jgi:hypothetical protein
LCLIQGSESTSKLYSLNICSASAAIWPGQKAENTLQLFFIQECHEANFLYILHLIKKKKKGERMMQNLLLGEQELRQGKKSCKRDNYM